jgi:hypothetical protein
MRRLEARTANAPSRRRGSVAGCTLRLANWALASSLNGSFLECFFVNLLQVEGLTYLDADVVPHHECGLGRGDREEVPLARHALELVSAAVFELKS